MYFQVENKVEVTLNSILLLFFNTRGYMHV